MWFNVDAAAVCQLSVQERASVVIEECQDIVPCPLSGVITFLNVVCVGVCNVNSIQTLVV